jgi:hypothetical protein
MLHSIFYDVAGPGVFILFGITVFLIYTAIVFAVEAVVLWLLKWGTIGRSLLSAFLMNLASSIVGIMAVGLFAIAFDNVLPGYIVALLLSILIEGGVLMLMKRGAVGENWRAAIIANLASYGLLGVYLLFQ